jgi:uncharacterized membrane protein YgcG
MKKLLLLMLMAFSLIVPASASARNVNDFDIQSFEADYFLSRDENNVSRLTTKETITAIFPNYDQNHGILRAIPSSYQGRNTQVKVTSVTDEDGNSYQYSKSSQNGNLVLKIGNPATYVRGKQIYNITYSQQEVIRLAQSDEGDQFYWDINGDQWPQVFGSVTARIHLTSEIAEQMREQQVCYTGSYGDTEQGCTVTTQQSEDEAIVTVQAFNLAPYETVTTAIAFNEGTFAEDELSAIWKVFIFGMLGLSVLLPGLVLLFVLRRWIKHGRDAKGRGVVVAQYAAPKDQSVVISDVVLNERMQALAVSATIIDLAVRKKIIIHEIKTGKIIKSSDYELELTNKYITLTSEEAEVITMFFGGDKPGVKVVLKDLQSTMYTKVKKLAKQAAKTAAEKGLFVRNPQSDRFWFIVPAILSVIVGFGLIVGGVFLLVASGYANTKFALPLLMPVALGFSFLVVATIFAIVSFIMPARTKKGAEMKEYLEGIKLYIKMAEAERIKYLQSPEAVKRFGDPKSHKTKVKLFEELLPYAMLFGLEKEWAKEFKDLYTQPPEWYDGNWSTFNTVALASSLHSFSSLSTQSFSPPSSSNSGGFSGGFSGGGGGGGGGGGW